MNYDEANWEMIISTLMSKDAGKIPAINRVLLIENSLDLAKTGHIPYDVPFELLSYLRNEEEYLPWKTALAKINYIGLMLRRSSEYGSFMVRIEYPFITNNPAIRAFLIGHY